MTATMLPRIAVIGAGIIGAAIAFRLAEKGTDVLLLDRAAPASGATAASYAWINANAKLPREYYELNHAAMREYRRLAWRLAPAYWYHADGNLIWYQDPDLAGELAERVARLREWGYEAELLPASQVISELEPGLAGGSADQHTTLAWFPEEAWVEAIAMTERLVEGVRNAGGRVLTGPEREVVGIDVDGDRVSSVTLRGGQTIPARAVVNAAGSNAPQVAEMVGRQLPLAPSPGLVVRADLPDADDLLRRPVETDHCAVRPDGPGRVLLSLDVDDAADLADVSPGPLPLDSPLVARLLACGSALAPDLAAATPTEAIVAPRPIPADGYPRVGAVTGLTGYYEAVTHSGVTLAPLIARSLTAEILGQSGDPLLSPYRPDRVIGDG